MIFISTESATIFSIDAFATDLRKMTVIYKSIDSEQKYLEEYSFLKKLFATFSHNWLVFVHRQILGQTTDFPVQQLNQEVFSGPEKDIWTAAYSFYSFFNSSYELFPTSHEIDSSGNFTTELPNFSRFVQKRPKNILYYQKLFRQASSVIKELPEQGVETVLVGNVAVKIHSLGKEDDRAIHTFINNLGMFCNEIKEAGLSKVLHGLTIHLDHTFTPKFGKAFQHRGYGGYYYAPEDELFINKVSDFSSETLFHELGHRFYAKNLDSNAKKEWEKFYFARKSVATKNLIVDLLKIIDTVAYESFFVNLSDIVAYIHKYKEKYVYWQDMIKFLDMTIKDDLSKRRSVEFLKKEIGLLEGEPFLEGEQLTKYGATNPDEMFAETFMLYINKSGRIPPKTLSFFKEICATSGTSLSSKANNSIEVNMITISISDEQDNVLPLNTRLDAKRAREKRNILKNIQTNSEQVNKCLQILAEERNKSKEDRSMHVLVETEKELGTAENRLHMWKQKLEWYT